MASAETGRFNNPLDLVEHIASKHSWTMDRVGEDELTLTVSGQWTDYHVSLNWRDEIPVCFSPVLSHSVSVLRASSRRMHRSNRREAANQNWAHRFAQLREGRLDQVRAALIG